MRLAAFVTVLLLITALFGSASIAQAAGISPSGGGSHSVGKNFTVTVTASGATFDALQGTISVSGPVKIISFTPGPATWLPGQSPANGRQFVGITNPTTSLRVATITLQGTAVGRGSVTVGGVKLARNGEFVGSSGGSSSFTITRAPTPPGGITVQSSTHPDQNESYDIFDVALSWEPPATGATGYATVLDQISDTVPEAEVTTTNTSATYSDLDVGTHYFHIRAQNSDGWGPPTHFQINIKEKTDDLFAPPVITSIEKTDNFTNDIVNGTVSGFKITGTASGLDDFMIELNIAPADPISSEQVLTTAIVRSTVENEPDTWEILFDQPIPSGFYRITATGQQDKIVTRPSEPVLLEVSVASGGQVKFITEDDLPKPATASRWYTRPETQGAAVGSIATIITILTSALARRRFFPRI